MALERRNVGGKPLTYKEQILTEPGLIAYWRFDGTSGHDEMGYADVSYVGDSVQTDQTGLIAGDSNHSFRPTNLAGSHVGGAWTSPDTSKFPHLRNMDADWTIECWVEFLASPTVDTVIATNGQYLDNAFGSHETWQIVARPGTFPIVGQIRARLQGATDSEVVWDLPALNVKHHVMVTFNNSDRKVRLWIDGALVGTGAALVTPVTPGSGLDAKFNWGLNGDGDLGISFNGLIDEGAVYDGDKGPVALTHYLRGA